MDDFRRQAGDDKTRYCEVTLAHAESEAAGLAMARDRFRFGSLTWPVMSELPSVEGFEAASRFIKAEDLASSVGAGPDPQAHLAAIGKYVEAGFDHIVLTGVGPDQAGFIDFFQRELKPRLGELH